jgi:hypothetical protein
MAGTADIVIDQNAAFSEVVLWENPDESPINMTGWVARLTARTRKKNSATEIFSLTSSPESGLVVDEPNGKITLQITSSMTAAWTFRFAFYDLLVWKPVDVPNTPTRLVEGTIRLLPGMTNVA